MATNYPTGLDSLSNPSAGDPLSSPAHSMQHANANDAIEAIETELGTTPSGVYSTVAARLDAIAGAGTASISLNNGTATAPSFYFTGDTNTGIWSPGADTLAVSTGGTERLRVNSSGNVGIGTSPGAKFHVAGDGNQIFLLDNSASQSDIRLRRYNGTLASPSAVASGDYIGRLTAQGYDGSAMRNAASIEFIVNGAVGASDMPGAISFNTTADGTATLTERMRIDNAGLITGTGTSLGAWTAWTPTLGGTGWAVGNATMTAVYCQIGKIVHFRINIVWGSTSTFGAGFLSLSLPVNNKTSSSDDGSGRSTFTDASTGKSYMGSGTIVSNVVYPAIILAATGETGGTTSTGPFTWASTDTLRVVGTYEIA